MVHATMDTPLKTSPNDSPEPTRNEAWEQIRVALRGLQFGTISIIVQDGVIVQIDRTEKRRIRRVKFNE